MKPVTRKLSKPRIRPIHHTFAPLGDRQQCFAAWKWLCQPWKWRADDAVRTLEDAFAQRFGGKAFAFASGRESLLAILQTLKLHNGEEVIVQGYTCIVVANAILAAGLQPVFVDIERDTLNLDLDALEKAITPQTRAIVCQHTFGIPAFTKALRALCDRHSLLLIEDCAHVIPDDKGPREIGTFGDILFFSFGRDKAISGVSGGMAVCRRPDICDALGKQQSTAKHLSLFHIQRLLAYPILYRLARPLYGIGIGKLLLAVHGKLGLLIPIVTNQEKRGAMPMQLHRMPNACATLAKLQWNKLQSLNDHRRMLTSYYFEEFSKQKPSQMLLGVTPDLPLQKFPLFVGQAERIRQVLKKKNIHLHDGWTGCVICPPNADAQAVGYHDGDDPSADMVGQQILCLPTHPGTSLDDAKKVRRELQRLL